MLLGSLSAVFLALITCTQAVNRSLPRTTPDAQSISSQAVCEFGEALKAVNTMPNFRIERQGHVMAAGWWKSETADEPHLLNPVRKSFTSMAEGLAIADDKLKFSGGGFRRAISTCFRYRIRSRKHPS
jgi:hypothetical protein